jgi:hypothetical protein
VSNELGIDDVILAGLEDYRVTSHGPNVWTREGVTNIIATSRWMRKARDIVNGKFTSVYRSPEVNAKVGGVLTSRHVRGLACDIDPYGVTPEEAAKILFKLAARGELGPVQQVIWEPTWVHVGWLSPEEASDRISYLKKDSSGYATLARPDAEAVA